MENMKALAKEMLERRKNLQYGDTEGFKKASEDTDLYNRLRKKRKNPPVEAEDIKNFLEAEGIEAPPIPKSGKAMKIAAELEPDDAMRETIAKMKPGAKLAKAAKSLAKGAGVLGVGLTALEIGDDAMNEELERKDEAAMFKASEDQAAKTKMKILKDKTGESLKNIKSLQASTKKNTPKVKAAPKSIPMPKGKSDEQKTSDYMGYMKSQLGTDYDDAAPKAKAADKGPAKGKGQAGVSDMGKQFEKAMDKNIKSEIKSGKYKDLKWSE